MKTHSLSILSACLAIVFGVQGQDQFTNGLVAYYPFNGNAIDESGNGNNASVSGAVLTADRFGVTDKAFHFNGAGDNINASIVSIPLGNSPRSIVAWIKPDSGGHPINGVIDYGNGDCSGLMFGISYDKSENDNLGFWGGCQDYASNLITPSNQWSFVALTYDGSNIRLYANGGSETYAIGALNTQNSSLWIGGETLNNGAGFRDFFAGSIDDVRFYNRALSALEVQQIHLYDNPPPQPPFANGLVAYYPFNGNANDESGNGFNGIVNGGLTLTEDGNGHFNAAYLFPGSGDSYIHVSNFDENLVSNALTMSVWFNFSGGTESPRLFNNYDRSRTVVTTGNSAIRTVQYFTPYAYLVTPDLTENTWHSLTVVETLSGAKMFLNGQFLSETSFTLTNIPFFGVFDIGRNVQGNEGWGGKMDQFRIYNRALTDLEVQQLYLYETSPTPSCALTEWPIASGGNGHFYQAVLMPAGIDWNSAKAEAEARGGYLATITSAAENDFVHSLIASDSRFWFNYGDTRGPWLGGFQADFSVEPGGGWTWVTGEQFSFSNWASGEPNNGSGGGTEAYLEYFGTGENNFASTWNDLPVEGGPRGYILEVEPIRITSQPLPQEASPGDTATFRVSVTNGTLFNYQWFFSNSIITGARSSQLTISNLAATNFGLYSVIVSNSCHSVTSNPARLWLYADSDGDGLSDFQEVENYHTNPNVSDTDGDGFSDYAEIYSGKNPLDTNSFPAAILSAFTAIELEFITKTGKVYQVQTSINLTNWTNLDSPIQGNGNIWTNKYSTRDQGKLFYRIEDVTP